MNAVSMALMDAAIPLNYSFSAMTCIYKDDVLMLDPTAAEIAVRHGSVVSMIRVPVTVPF
jgi:ribonuclease PH